MNIMRTEMKNVSREAIERCDLFTGRKKIFVCGGYDGKTRLNSTEYFDWAANVWTPGPLMKETRTSHSSFVHEQHIFVSGGWTGTKCTHSIESLNVDEERNEWIEFPAKMPIKCYGHRMIRHENRAIVTGGLDDDNVSNGIYEISLKPPHRTKLLRELPEANCHHACEVIDNQIVIAGGGTSKYIKDAKSSVYLYDVNTNKCKATKALPFAVTGMASVSYKGGVILIGGVNEKCQTLSTVINYDVKTGKVINLPNLNRKRARTAAVIIGNVILVMGGYHYETKTHLNSVEYLDLNTNVWRELSPMTSKRGNLTAVVKPFC